MTMVVSSDESRSQTGFLTPFSIKFTRLGWFDEVICQVLIDGNGSNFGTPGVSNLTIIRSFKAFSESLHHLFDFTYFMCENDLSFMTDVSGKQNN